MDTLNDGIHARGRLGGRRRWNEVDAALLALVRLVLDDGWSARRAATELRAKVTDEVVLRRIRIRVENALAERPTPVAERAALTLDEVFSNTGRHAVSTGQ